MSASRCHVCDRPREDWECLVAMRNGLYVEACWSCWFRWPDGFKTFPAVGFGRGLENEPPSGLRTHVVYDDQGDVTEYELRAAARPRLTEDELEALVSVLREAA